MRYLLAFFYVSGCFYVSQRWAQRYCEQLLRRQPATWRAVVAALGALWQRSAYSAPPFLSNTFRYSFLRIRMAECGYGCVAIVVVAAVFEHYSSWLSLTVFCILSLVLCVLSYLDLHSYILPDCLVLLLLLLLLLWRYGVAPQVAYLLPVPILSLTLGVSLLYFLTNYLGGRSVLGMGDVKLWLAMLWVCTSLIQWLSIFIFASVLAASTQMWLQMRWWPKGYCAFGPYLSMAFFILQYGPTIAVS